MSFIKPKDAHLQERLQLPCGTCIACREEQARQMAVRITHEAQQWEDNSFITLTYSQENLPKTGSLQYDDLQKFWKRLRKQTGRLRYYAVGEYGDESMRPHYHACVFGLGFRENRIIIRETPNLLWLSPQLEKTWGLGQVTVGKLSFETARYTASYVTKKLRTKQKYVRIDEATGELLEVEQPKAFMSRNLALEWFEKFGKGVSDHDRVVINARPQKPPKAYDKWIARSRANFVVSPGGITWRAETDGIRKLEKIKQRRKDRASTLSLDQSRAHARNARARVKRKSRSV